MKRHCPPLLLLLPVLFASLVAASEGDLDPAWTGPQGDDAGYTVFNYSMDDFFIQILPGPEVTSYGRITHGQNLASTTIVRFTPDGDYDATFGDDGEVTFGSSNLPWSRHLAIDADGRCVVLFRGGRLHRLQTDGTVDAAFGTDGTSSVIADSVDLSDGAYFDTTTLTIDPADGSLWVGGWLHRTARNHNFLVVHLTADGAALASGFGDGGIWEADLAGYADEVDRVLPTGDRVLVAGRAAIAAAHRRQGYLLALTRAGAADTTFGTDGARVEQFGSADDNSRVSLLEPLPDGRLLIAGSVDSDDHQPIRVYQADGQTDASFVPASIVPKRKGKGLVWRKLLPQQRECVASIIERMRG